MSTPPLAHTATPLTTRQQQRLRSWMRSTHVSAQAPADWAASGECARLLAQTLVRYAAVLGGDLTHAEVRADLRCLRAVVDMTLDAGTEQARRIREQRRANKRAHTTQALHRRAGTHRSLSA